MKFIPESLAEAAAPFDFFRGDATGLSIPAREEALREAGAGFLTRAFRAYGSLGADNAVARIVRMEPCLGGSTGVKLFLTVEYDRPDPALHTELFAKFSRDFSDARRDGRGRWEMASEVPFETLTRMPGFPIAVPCAYFADYEMETGTGFIVTERVAYGNGVIEPHRRKCLDHQTMDDPLAYYRLVIAALARLCAAHKSGRLSPDIDRIFPFDPATGSADPIRYTHDQLRAELDTCLAFARNNPHLLPERVRSEEFLARMERDVWHIQAHEAEIQRYLTGNPDLIALCHWNAHIDNCFFWREAGELRCGLIDWGRVGQITFGSILWGGISAAHHDIWNIHLDSLLELFVREYRDNGGPTVSAEELEFHLTLHMADMGVARVLAFPEVVNFRLPEAAHASGPHDPMFLPVSADPARNSLHIYTNFLEFWLRQDFGKAVDRLLSRG